MPGLVYAKERAIVQNLRNSLFRACVVIEVGAVTSGIAAVPNWRALLALLMTSVLSYVSLVLLASGCRV